MEIDILNQWNYVFTYTHNIMVKKNEGKIVVQLTKNINFYLNN